MTAMESLAQAYPTKRAFITGAASGFGAALATRLVAAGWSVGLLDRDADSLARLSGGLGRRTGTVVPFAVDIRDEIEVGRSIDAFATDGLEMLVNAAGIGAGGSIEELGSEVWREVFDINLFGAVHSTRAALPHLKRNGRGIVWNVASAAAFHGLPRVGVYNASKAAMLALSEALAAELALESSSVRVAVEITTFYESNLHRWTLGPELDRRRTEALMRRSGLSADDIVAASLSRLARGDFYIVMPARARWLWRFKRLWPTLYLRVLPQLTRHLLARLDTDSSVTR